MRQIARNNRNKRGYVNFATINNRFWRSALQIGWTHWRRCFYKRTCVRVEFLHLREKTKIKRLTDFSGIRPIIGLKNDGPGRTIRKVEA